MVSNKHCCYGTCNNDTRYANRPEMAGVWFMTFPKPITKLDKCKRWIRNCGRPEHQFNIDRITRNTYICSKHFVGGNGPTTEHPDPIPATACSEQVEKFSKRKRPTPKKRAMPVTKKQKMDAASALLNLSSSMTPMDVTYTEKQNTRATQTDCIQYMCSKHTEVKDGSSQTVYEKYVPQSKVETIIVKNEMMLNTSPSPVQLDSVNTASLSFDAV